jgi:hypothetical protein
MPSSSNILYDVSTYGWDFRNFLRNPKKRLKHSSVCSDTTKPLNLLGKTNSSCRDDDAWPEVQKCPVVGVLNEGGFADLVKADFLLVLANLAE